MSEKRLFATRVIAVFGLLSFTIVAQQSTAHPALTADAVYRQYCAKCHGKTAEGRHFGGPSLLSEKASTASDDELRAMIANGKGRMPKFAGKLTPEQIDALVKEIEALTKK